MGKPFKGTRALKLKGDINMKHSAQFIIEKGVLKNYNGRDSVVVVPDRVTSIGGWAFRGFQGLTSITLPEGVTSIE